MTNHSRVVFVVNDDVRCVLCSYEGDWKQDNGKIVPPPRDQWTEYKTFNQNLKVGDFVVVPTNTRHGMTVVRVEEINVTPDVKSSKTMNWVIDVVDRAGYEDVLEVEKGMIDQIKVIDRERERREIRKTILGDNEEHAKKISFATPKQIGQG